MNRELISKIAQEAHTMGRIYEKVAAPVNPAIEFGKVEEMVERFIKANATQPGDASDPKSCGTCKGLRYIGGIDNFAVCPDCSGG